MEITCINCPVGCRLQVEMADGKVVSVTGHVCKRGETYAHQECVNPERMITAVVPVTGSLMPLSVKTERAIPKKDIRGCLEALAKVEVQAPVKIGQVIVRNVCNCGVDVIATKEIKKAGQ